jgi:hypothetical protein
VDVLRLPVVGAFLRWRHVRLLLQPWLLLTLAMMVVGATLHYGDKLPLLSEAAASSPLSLTTRQSLERILFLLPVMSAAFVFGGRAGLLTLAVSLALMFPRAVWDSVHTDHALPEVGGIMVVGALLVLAITQQRREVLVQMRCVRTFITLCARCSPLRRTSARGSPASFTTRRRRRFSSPASAWTA